MSLMIRMKLTKLRLLSAAAVLGVALAPVAIPAQSRQDQQMLQELRILQEQVQQLRTAVAALAEQTKATNARLDNQETLVRTNHADDSDTLRAVKAQVDALSERVNQYAQQVGRFGAEITSLRAGLDQQQKSLDKIMSLLVVPPPTAPADVNIGAPPPAGTPLPPSAAAAFQYARGLYASGPQELAVAAFQSFLQTFPDATAYLGEANYWMGMSQFSLGNYTAAKTALQAVIDTYKTSDKVPDAYFQLGECYKALGKRPEAIAAYDEVIRRFPDSSAALRAKVSKGTIKSLNRPEDDTWAA
jgi:tol-pal system protein YbgF